MFARTFLAAVLAWASVAPAAGGTIRVDLSGDGDFTDLQAALDAAREGDVVLVAPGLYAFEEPLDFNRFTVNRGPVRNLIVRSERGPLETTLAYTGGNVARASTVIFDKGEDARSKLVGFTIRGGIGTAGCPLPQSDRRYGAGVLFCRDSNAVLENCVITGGVAFGGGGIATLGSSPTIRGCEITANSAIEGGGAYSQGGAPVFEDCAFTLNLAHERGGGMFSVGRGEPLLRDCVLADNRSTVYGGGLAGRLSNLRLRRSTVLANEAVLGGGGAYYFSGRPWIRESVISENSVVGAPFNHGDGAGLLLHEVLDAVVEATVFERNEAAVGEGGAVGARESSATFSDCSILRNFAAVGGSAFNLESMRFVMLTRCRVAGNTWSNAIDHDGTTRSGDPSELLMTDCEVTGNGSDRARGGALDNSAVATLINCTIAGNRFTPTGAAVRASGDTTIRNCIIWDHLKSVNVSSRAPFRATYSCIQDASFLGEGNEDVDPHFERPGFWRRPDEPARSFEWVEGSYRLVPDSPLIDKGHDDASPRDLDGNARPCGAGVDMGAYESGDCAAHVVRFRRGDLDEDGRHNLTDVLIVLGVLFFDTPWACLDAADIDADRVFLLTDALFLLNHLFLGGPRPPEPFAACGTAGTGLGCVAFDSCAAD